MSRRATREAHAKIVSLQRPEQTDLDAQAYLKWKKGRDYRRHHGCSVLLAVAMLCACAHTPTPQDQADLQALAATVSHASACVPEEEATASMQALARLGARLSSKAQAEALWQAATPTLQAVAHWLAGWVLQRPPP